MMPHTRDMRKNPGIKRSYLPLPDQLTGKQSYCITIPDGLDNKRVLVDLLTMATYWFNWERSDGTEGKQTADAWRDALKLPELNMCCCPEPTNRRYNEDGELEVSYDGGLTWSLAPDADDRFSGIVAPPISGADGSEKACAAAASAEEYVKLNFIEDLDEGDTYSEIFAAGVAIVGALGVTGIGILIAAAAAAIFVAGVAAVQSAFTTEVWTDFRCILYCRISDDGSFTKGAWEGVKSDVLSKFTGVVSAVLYNWVNSVGPVGLTNAARSGFVATADCDSCECDDCVSKYEIWTEGTPGYQYGEIVDIGENYLDVSPGPQGYMILKATNINNCCFVGDITVVSGDLVGAGFLPCGTDFSGSFIGATPVGQCCSYIQCQGTPGSVSRILLGPCE